MISKHLDFLYLVSSPEDLKFLPAWQRELQGKTKLRCCSQWLSVLGWYFCLKSVESLLYYFQASRWLWEWCHTVDTYLVPQTPASEAAILGMFSKWTDPPHLPSQSRPEVWGTAGTWKHTLFRNISKVKESNSYDCSYLTV